LYFWFIDEDPEMARLKKKGEQTSVIEIEVDI
jgi:hypothetical protein